jgi:Ca2+-binding EF-hand superfamily protein
MEAFRGACELLARLAQAFTCFAALQAPQTYIPNQTVAPANRQRVFERIDLNGDHFLSIEEFAEGSVGKAKDSKLLEFKKYDKNNNGTLDITEFRVQQKRPSVDKLGKEFEGKDKDKDGVLTMREFVDGLSGNKLEKALVSFSQYDHNIDERVSREEYVSRAKKVKPSKLLSTVESMTVVYGVIAINLVLGWFGVRWAVNWLRSTRQLAMK